MVVWGLTEDSNVRNGVFLSSEPRIHSIKACALFWKHIFVFESYLGELRDNSLFELSKELFGKGILKVVQDSKQLEANLHDKIYYTLGKEKWDYLVSNVGKIAVPARTPENMDSIIKESTKRDEQNEKLIQSIKQGAESKIVERWMQGMDEVAGARFWGKDA